MLPGHPQQLLAKTTRAEVYVLCVRVRGSEANRERATANQILAYGTLDDKALINLGGGGVDETRRQQGHTESVC